MCLEIRIFRVFFAIDSLIGFVFLFYNVHRGKSNFVCQNRIKIVVFQRERKNFDANRKILKFDYSEFFLKNISIIFVQKKKISLLFKIVQF